MLLYQRKNQHTILSSKLGDRSGIQSDLIQFVGGRFSMDRPKGMFSEGPWQPCDSILSVLNFGLEPE